MEETEVLKHLNKAIEELYTVDSNTSMDDNDMIPKFIDQLTEYRYETYGTFIDWDKVDAAE